MKNRLFPSLLLSCAVATAVRGDVLQLRDKAAVSGTILTEKRDAVVIDLGYTVLTVPRNQIVRIGRDEELTTQTAASKARDKNKKPDSPAATKRVESAKPQAGDGLYSVSSTPPPERSVRELVNQLGESVVQVRTPGGLGSGFFINEDGYLITNFHVIEGESQISIEVYLRRNGQLERTGYKQLRIVAMNKFQDLALLKVEDKDAPKFSPVALGDTEALAVGERVF